MLRSQKLIVLLVSANDIGRPRKVSVYFKVVCADSIRALDWGMQGDCESTRANNAGKSVFVGVREN